MSRVKTHPFYSSFEEKFKNWAKETDNIQAAFIIGSRARMDHPADEWSDMDIVLYTYNHEYYIEHSDWLKPFGNIISSFAFMTAGKDMERLTLFEGGWQVDFVIQPYEVLKKMSEKRTIPQNFLRGVKVIVDKEQISSKILPDKFTAPLYTPVSEEIFLNTVQMFWFGVMYVAKQILRNELWVVKTRDIELKNLLLQMIEWHERAKNGNDYDTWHAGRFIYQWADSETYKGLFKAFGHFDKIDSWNALLNSASLFKRLSKELSEKLGFKHSPELENHVYSWIYSQTNLIAEN